MNTNPASKVQSNDPADQQISWLRAVIRDCVELPTLVREAEFARVDERCLDESLLNILCAHKTADTADEATQLKVLRRAKALKPYVGKKLICVSIRLPGVGYTIEVDPQDKRIVHWEWAAA